jgi:hypothetical protein
LIAVVMNFFAQGDHIREVAAIVKLLEFVLIPGFKTMSQLPKRLYFYSANSDKLVFPIRPRKAMPF